MYPEIIVAFAVRLFSIFLAIYSLQFIASMASHLRALDGVSFIYLVTALSMMAISFLLWSFPSIVARKLIGSYPGNDLENLKIFADIKQVQLASISILTIYLLFNVVSDLVMYFSVLALMAKRQGVPLELSLEYKASMIATVAELVFVLFLLLRKRQVISLLSRC
ncbi:hypothetical protein [Thiorhodococcus minor]|uniref:Uncharacterized protein n=1 Tax=Thiorhodococcus minor TaxID=57489 RepID=A0A6M0K6I2_9GAMM|nr:hypothetical protein [Thiorhodococcus minor]NEV65386.1 hypothetical protein [Thiorhodococcus minor]